MKIYQLHEYSGSYDDFRDMIIGSYLKKERAEEEKTKMETKEKELIKNSKRCTRCPFLEEDFDNLDNLLLEYPDYCDNAKFENEEDYGIDCKNYYTHWDKSTFEIKEVEVEE